MSHGWNTTALTSEDDVLQTFLHLQGRSWLGRGYSRCHGALVPRLIESRTTDSSGRRSSSVNAAAFISFDRRRVSFPVRESSSPSLMTSLH
jgi:hypothetical protein